MLTPLSFVALMQKMFEQSSDDRLVFFSHSALELKSCGERCAQGYVGH